MSLALEKVLAALNRSRALLEAVLRATDDPAERAARLADLLRALWPSSVLCACRLQAEDHAHACVLDKAGRLHPEWAKALDSQLTPRNQTGRRTARRSVKLPRTLKLPGQILAVEEVVFRDRHYGVLALAVAEDASAETETTARTLLALCAEQLALRLHLEAREREKPAGLDWRADIGEVAGPVAHEVNNFLNVVLLHVAVLEQEAPRTPHSDVTAIRQQGTALAALVEQFQQYRQQRQLVPQPVDLNHLAADIVETFERTPDGVPIRLALSPELPPVLGSAPDLKRLLTFLLTHAAAVMASGNGRITVRTEHTPDRILLHVEDTGPGLAAENLSRMFEPGGAGREGTNRLELAACQSLARRLQGRIHAENLTGGGVAVVVELLPARGAGRSRE